MLLQIHTGLRQKKKYRESRNIMKDTFMDAHAADTLRCAWIHILQRHPHGHNTHTHAYKYSTYLRCKSFNKHAAYILADITTNPYAYIFIKIHNYMYNVHLHTY